MMIFAFIIVVLMFVFLVTALVTITVFWSELTRFVQVLTCISSLATLLGAFGFFLNTKALEEQKPENKPKYEQVTETFYRKVN